MPVRLRITLLFSLLVFVILALVCSGIYYFSYEARRDAIQTRLANRAITTARLLSQREVFDYNLVRRIDSSTTLALKNKAVQAYDAEDRKFYNYSDRPGDTIRVEDAILRDTRENGALFFTQDNKEAVAYHYTGNGADMVVVSGGEDEAGRKNLASLLQILFVSFLIGNILVLVSGYFFSRGLLLPVKRITQDVEEISARSLARRITTGNTKDEWYQLAHTLNSLLNRLQESFELQRRFISNASHELSTPLTAISSQLEVSLQRERGAEEYKKVMQSIYQDTQHMNKLTQTLLEFAKASGDPGGLDIDLVRLDEVLLALPADVVRSHPSFSVTLAFDELPENEERLLVFGNEALLQTAIRNLVLNACKYSEDQQATVRLRESGQGLEVSVEDRGIGIPEEELEKIFQPFYRVAERERAGGFGLGLSLAEKIIRIHKGTITVASVKGEGTRFLIRLPSAHHPGAVKA